MTDWPKNLFEGRRYAVVGLGRAGLASLRALACMGARVVGWDDAAFAREGAEREGFTVVDPTHEIGEFDALLLSPGIPHRLPVPHRVAAAARMSGTPILTDAELLYQAVRGTGSRARFAGITGTNGKSTTAALLAHILRGDGVACAAGANLGPAALSLPPLADDGVYVLEMSSYMLERLATLRFDVAVMLNLSPDHLDRHGDLDGYRDAKMQIFARQAAGDAAIFGIDDPVTASLAAAHAGCVRISGVEPAYIGVAGTCLRDSQGEIIDLRRAAALPGAHNAQNAAAAAAAALALGLSRAAIARGIAGFPGLPHRQERVAEIDGIKFVNDSKATNADAASRALACYEHVVWIAGGIAKAGGIEPLAPHFSRVSEALLIGRDAEEFAATLSKHGVAFRLVQTLECAVALSIESAKSRAADIVLLSPACASFDQFSGFEERGTRFRDLVLALAPAGAG